ncbi:hypothetical protein UO65_3859 [Actinokineospora spheciospongiae]|uniref:Glycosyltransferase n=1 Tax=Actinokineospora spheciospongiae TaxID=909613 RepID=W7J465_9PSEU|nr:glycosyltransferase [Actinokineospora spheciospongiae]EWC60929.1 hypothetical protein UO65_3859 [Actinokineospora spheciospongiae]
MRSPDPAAEPRRPDHLGRPEEAQDRRDRTDSAHRADPNTPDEPRPDGDPNRSQDQDTAQDQPSGRDPTADPERVQDGAEPDRATDPGPTPDERRDTADAQDADDVTHTFLMVCTEYSPEKGGVVVFNRALAEALADAGHNVIVRIGEDASRYADAQRPNLRIIGPRDLPASPDSRTLLGTADDPDDMPDNVDFVIGHTRFSGPDAAATRDARYPDAKLVHFVHMVPEALGRVKADDDPNDRAAGIVNHAIERDLVAGADLAVGVGPAIAENVREMVEQARAAGGPVATKEVHELIPGMEFVDRRPRSIEGREMKVLLFGRADVGQKGAKEAARVVSMLQAAGRPVQLTVRGVPAKQVVEQQEQLAVVARAEVEVRPFTTDRADLHTDLDDADVMVMTSRAEGFGLTAQEAAGAGVPVVVPSSSGFGRWLGDGFSAANAGPSIVEQGFEDRVPEDRWFEALKNVADNYDDAQERALALQQEFKDQNVTWSGTVESLIDALGRL